MTAHVIYDDIDQHFTATHSKKIINIIRNKIKFKNIIMTDDISMKSLKFSIKENTIQSFKAGCNLVLHCNGNYREMLTVAKNSPIIDDFIIKKTSQFHKILKVLGKMITFNSCPKVMLVIVIFLIFDPVFSNFSFAEFDMKSILMFILLFNSPDTNIFILL